MNFFKNTLFALLLIANFAPTPVLAKGEITVERDNGDTDIHSDVEISNTSDILYLKPGDGDTILLITKNKCESEGELLVCNDARVGLESNGVIEELDIEEIVLFINATGKRQKIEGSKVAMTPNTVVLEFATTENTFVTAVGKIDSTTRPAEASR